MPDTVIKTERLSKKYGRRLGIAAVDLDIHAGEVFGYLGPNGAGKTTTIRVLLDFIRADSGRAEIFGLDVRRRSVDIHRRVGFLPGEVHLYENLSCSEHLRFLANLRGKADWAYVRELAERLDCPLSQPIHSLSLGNKRKVGLIQALMHRPDLIILDEPTGGLDPIAQHEFYRLLAEARARGQTLFLSSHNLPEVERVCDRVAVIRAGRLVATENVAALKTRSLRSLEIRFAEDVDARAFAAVPGLEIVAQEKRLLKGRLKGEVDPLLKAASRFKVSDWISREPSLEEIFLAYYGSDDHAR